MNELRLLIIEDDKDFHDSYLKQIKLFNRDHTDIEVNCIFAESAEDAKSNLEQGQFDAAIVDMKLGSSDTEYAGNELIEIIKNNLRFPTFVLTANPEKIEEEKGNENDLFKIKVKGSDEGNFTTILNELKEIHQTKITKILGKSGQIEKYLNDIFWKHLSKSINVWATDKTRNSDEKEKSLLRYTLSHIQEYIDQEMDLYHPSEFYISPRIKTKIYTGDILKNGDKNWIVLTPACDLATDAVRKEPKAKFVTLALIEDIESITQGKDSGVVKKLKSNNLDLKYHFLPETSLFQGGFVNFQYVQSVPIQECIENFEIKCIVTNPFIKDIISRFSNYFSRQGQPVFS